MGIDFSDADGSIVFIGFFILAPVVWILASVSLAVSRFGSSGLESGVGQAYLDNLLILAISQRCSSLSSLYTSQRLTVPDANHALF